MSRSKEPRPDATRNNSKHRAAAPADGLRATGLEVGEQVLARADGPKRFLPERERDVLAELSGALTGIYSGDEIERLRAEWR